MAFELRSSKIEHQFIKSRINLVELQMTTLSEEFTTYNKKIAQHRDSGDKLAKTFLAIATKEVLNPTLRLSLAKFSDIIRAIQDFREATVQRIEHLTILEFSSYSHLCNKAKEQLKKSFEARACELLKREQLEKVRAKKPVNWQHIIRAEKSARKAKNEASEATMILSQHIDSFERRKLEDMKRILLEFVKIEMVFHAKALELLTKAHQTVGDIKPQSDLKSFRNHFKTCMSTIGTNDICAATDNSQGDSAQITPPQQVPSSPVPQHDTILLEGPSTSQQQSYSCRPSCSSSGNTSISSNSIGSNNAERKKILKTLKEKVNDIFKN